MADILSIKEINEHPLLDNDHRTLAREMRKMASQTRERFTMLDFAAICLRATARNYVECDETESTATAVIASKRLQETAVFYVYEALRACDIPIVTQWPDFDEMLKCLVSLSKDMP